MNVYVGMDVHRKRSQIAIVDEAGDQQRNRNVPNDPAKLVPILGALEPGTPVALEAAYGWGWLVDLLEELELEPRLVHPSRCKAIASARLKNDKVDARTLAQLLRADLLPEAWIAPPSRSATCAPCCATGPAWSARPPPARAGCMRCWPTAGSRSGQVCGPVPGGRGWPALPCRRPSARSWTTCADCWTPWPRRSAGWSRRSARSPSPTPGSRRSWSYPVSAG
jgi:hypothetical protein